MMAESQNCFTIQWSIENFSMCLHECGVAMLSPHFREESSQNQVWYLKLYPGGYCDHSDHCDCDEEFIAIELCNTMEVCGVFDCTISVLDKCGWRHFETNTTNKNCDNCSIIRIEDFVEREKLFDKKILLLPSDTLTVQCVIRKSYRLHSIRQSLKLQCLSFTWHIKQFSLIRHRAIKPGTYDGGFDNASHLFYPLSLNFADAPKLTMQFGVKKNSPVESKIYLRFNKLENNCETCPVYFTYEISAMHVKGYRIDLIKGQHVFKSCSGADSHISPIVMLEDRGNLVQNDTLILHVNLRLSDGSLLPKSNITESLCHAIPQPKSVPSRFSRSPNVKLYGDEKFCDVVFKVGTKSLSAHKVVLCTQSDVFGSMFDSDMAESDTGVVRITDIDADTMKRFLKLLYTGIVDDDLSCEEVSKLYSAAHKYQVPFLDIVSSVLVSKVAMDNAWELWSFATRYQDAALKAAVKSFISLSINDIDATNEDIDNGKRQLPEEQSISKKLKRTSC